MPEFILDLGTPEASKQFRALDSFTQGYIEAMFFTSTGDPDDAENSLENATVAELAPETLAAIIADCKQFQYDQGAILDDAYTLGKAQGCYDEQRAGNDYWYSRNGCGTGYWDRGLSDVGIALHDAAKHSELNLCRGNDGLIYLS